MVHKNKTQKQRQTDRQILHITKNAINPVCVGNFKTSNWQRDAVDRMTEQSLCMTD